MIQLVKVTLVTYIMYMYCIIYLIFCNVRIFRSEQMKIELECKNVL